MTQQTELPAFLQPKKQKPGPKAGVLSVKSPCPHCGEPAHRKAIQTVKGHGPLRRMYCANGCGHYHYRDVKTNEVVEAGKGPKVDPLAKPDTDWLRSLSVDLGINPLDCVFTSYVEGSPRAIVYGLSDGDIDRLPSEDDRMMVERLQRTLLTVQACLRVYNDRAKGKGKK